MPDFDNDPLKNHPKQDESYSWATAEKVRERLHKNPPPLPIQENWDEAERVEGVYSSNAIEGSTLTLGETEAVLRGATVPGKELNDHLAAINLNLAWKKMKDWAKNPITEHLLLKIHQIILTRINDEDAGRYRNRRVRIIGSEHVAPNPLVVSEKMTEVFKDFAEIGKRTPIEHAADLHSGIVTVHPFVDGNGRSSRLIQNVALMRGGFWPITIPLSERARYIEATAQANAGNYEPYRNYILEKVIDQGLQRLAMYDERFA